MDKPDSRDNFKLLGKQLKDLRTKSGESLAEASGAVEVDVRQLANYELGQGCPTEDVLILLISHFNVADDQAVRMWELAGYADKDSDFSNSKLEALLPGILTEDKPVLFTDVVDVMVNNYGVVMNFMQGGANSSSTVARIGMSREHAKSVLQILQATLTETEKYLGKKSIAPTDTGDTTIG